MTMTGKFRDISTTITTGGTAQTLAAVDANRSYILIHNPRTESESLLVSLVGTAVSGNAVELAPGGTIEFTDGKIPTNLVSVLAATTGHKIVAWVN